MRRDAFHARIFCGDVEALWVLWHAAFIGNFFTSIFEDWLENGTLSRSNKPLINKRPLFLSYLPMD